MIKSKVFSILAILFIFASIIFPIVQPQPVSAAAVVTDWLDGWQYRVKFFISGSSEDELTDYQLPFTIDFGAGTNTGQTIYVNGNSQNDFDDIRFTTIDGTTLLDTYTEYASAGNDAYIWVEFDTIQQHPRGSWFYCYYGNATAASVSNGSATFPIFEDFEWGNDGDLLTDDGGSVDWTIGAGTVEISTAQDIGDVAGYFGTRSARFVGAAANNPSAYFTLVASDCQAFRWRIYKETQTDDTRFFRGNGTVRSYIKLINNPCDIYYNDGGDNDTGQNMNFDDWELLESKDYDFDAATYDIYYANAGNIAASIQNDADMNISASTSNLYLIQSFGDDATEDVFIDDFIVYSYRDDPPDVIKYYDEQYLCGVETHYMTGRDTVHGEWAILSGELTGTNSGNVTTIRGFDYGITTTMVNEIYETGTWTEAEPYSMVVTSLAGPGSDYYYRAKVYNGTSWVYGEQKRFSLSPSQYEWYDENDDGILNVIYADRWAYQTFTVSDIAFSITHIDLYCYRTGTPGDVVVSIREAGDGIPNKEDLATATLNGDTFETSAEWVEWQLTSEVSLEYDKTYAIIVRAEEGSAGNEISWRADTSASIYPQGNIGQSTDYGYSWTETLTTDAMFRVWGLPVLEVNEARSFSSYAEDDDWLFTARLLNEYPPYYDSFDVSDMFYIQLIDDDGSTVLAQHAVADWGYRPGSIYINAGEVASLNWGNEYRIRVWGDFENNPYAEYVLFTDDWMGSDLNNLDSWCIATAVLMEDYYGTSFTEYITGKGLVINETGSAIFRDGIPAITDIRPDIFSVTVEDLVYDAETFDEDYQDTIVWEAMLGTYITSVFNQVGDTIGVTGAIFGLICFAIMYALVGTIAFSAGHTVAGVGISWVFILIAAYVGVLDLVVLAALWALGILLLVREFWFKGG